MWAIHVILTGLPDQATELVTPVMDGWTLLISNWENILLRRFKEKVLQNKVNCNYKHTDINLCQNKCSLDTQIVPIQAWFSNQLVHFLPGKKSRMFSEWVLKGSDSCSVFKGISDGPNVSALTNGLDTPEERYTKLKKVYRLWLCLLLLIWPDRVDTNI